MSKFKNLKDGFHAGLGIEEYHASRDHESSSSLKMFLSDPELYKQRYVLGIKQKGSTAMDFGTYIHALILEPETVAEEFAIFTGPRRAGKVWEQFQKDNSRKIIVTSSQKSKADLMVDNFNNRHYEVNGKKTFVRDLIVGGKAEETLLQSINDMKVKVRFDYRVNNNILDVKTSSADVGNIIEAKDACNHWYYGLSAALYVDCAEKATGDKHDFYFLFMSKRTNETTVYKASEKLLDIGRKQYKLAMEGLKIARDTGIYENRESILEI